MAAFDLESFRSEQFVFVIGKNQTAFKVHAAVIAKQSKALDVLINGCMKEAFSGKATFEDIEEDTFSRFCQFAYSGDYASPDFIHRPANELRDLSPPAAISYNGSAADCDDSEFLEPEPALEPELEPVHVLDWEPTSKKAKKAKKSSKSDLLRQSLDDRVYDTETFHTNLAARFKVRPNSDPTDDYTTVFLGHAQLYVFAEKWGIGPLKTLTLSQLHKTLTSFTLYAVRRPDIVELLRYTFSDNHTPDLVDGVDDLRSLVMHYAACEAESLTQCPEFLSLIRKGGPFAQDLVQMLMKRIC